eukprot:6203379-Pleurochrysis_carterae.AAC.5
MDDQVDLPAAELAEQSLVAAAVARERVHYEKPRRGARGRRVAHAHEERVAAKGRAQQARKVARVSGRGHRDNGRGCRCIHGGLIAAQQRRVLRVSTANGAGESARGGVVEEQRTWQRLAAVCVLQLVAQLHCAERVEPRLHQRRVGVDGAADSPSDQTHQLGYAQRRCKSRSGSNGCAGATAAVHQIREERRNSRGGRHELVPFHRRHGHHRRALRGEGPAQCKHPFGGGNEAEACKTQARIDGAARGHAHL